MENATLNLKINKWIKAVIVIIKEYKKLEDSYIRAFDDIIYYTENSFTPGNIQKNVDKLYEYLDGCVQSDFTTTLRDFCKLSETALIDNFSDFKTDLKSRRFFYYLEQTFGYVPALKKEDREREQIETELREKEKLEAERRSKKEEDERLKRLEAEKKRREYAEKIRKETERVNRKQPKRLIYVSVCVCVIAAIVLLFIGLGSPKKVEIPDERPLSSQDTEIIVGNYSLSAENGTMATATITYTENQYILTVFSSYKPVVGSISFDSGLAESSMIGNGTATVNDKTKTISIILNKDGNQCKLIKYF